MLRRPARAAAQKPVAPMTDEEQEALLAEVAQEAGTQRKIFQQISSEFVHTQRALCTLCFADLQHQELLVTRFGVPQPLLSVSYLSILLCIGCSAASVYNQLPHSLLVAARVIALLTAVAWLFAVSSYTIRGPAGLVQAGWLSLGSASALAAAVYVRRELESLQHSTQELQDLRYSCRSALHYNPAVCMYAASPLVIAAALLQQACNARVQLTSPHVHKACVGRSRFKDPESARRERLPLLWALCVCS
eukprot:19302-Heterococcus_DN1.PRE.2